MLRSHIEDRHGLNGFYRQSWGPYMLLESRTYFFIELKTVYQESVGNMVPF